MTANHDVFVQRSSLGDLWLPISRLSTLLWLWWRQPVRRQPFPSQGPGGGLAGLGIAADDVQHACDPESFSIHYNAVLLKVRALEARLLHLCLEKAIGKLELGNEKELIMHMRVRPIGEGELIEQVVESAPVSGWIQIEERRGEAGEGLPLERREIPPARFTLSTRNSDVCEK